MGAAKSIPLISEVVTVGESVGKGIAAAGCAMVGDKNGAKKLREGAKNAWVDYTDRQPIAAGIKIGVLEANNDKDGANKVREKLKQSYEELADSTPVIGHVKGVVHYALGDKEHGDKCMKDASKGAVVAAATAATGGAAAGVAAVASGVAMDGIITGFDSAVHGEYKPHGQVAAVTQAVKTGDPNDIVDAALAPVADFAFGRAGKSGKTRAIENTLKDLGGKKKGQLQHHNLARDAADHLKTAYSEMEGVRPVSNSLKKNQGVATIVKDLETGEQHRGYSAKPRQRMEPDLANEMNRNEYKSSLQDRIEFPENHQNPISRRPQNCAEHQAYDSFFRDQKGKARAENAIEVSVQRSRDGCILIVERCENCRQFADVMGSVKMEFIGKDMTSARWNFLTSTVYGIQVAAVVSVEVAWRGGNYIMIANMPSGETSAKVEKSIVEKIIVYTSKENQCISGIQFVLSDGHSSEFGKKSDYDEKEDIHVTTEEYVEAVVFEVKEKKVIGFAVNINGNQRQLAFGNMEDDLSDHYCFEAPNGHHIIGLYEGTQEAAIIAYARKD
jgi:hypothetical protein